MTVKVNGTKRRALLDGGASSSYVLAIIINKTSKRLSKTDVTNIEMIMMHTAKKQTNICQVFLAMISKFWKNSDIFIIDMVIDIVIDIEVRKIDKLTL